MQKNLFCGKYCFFTSNELKASGWLERQLRIQAAGLAGNLDKVWPDVRDSQWIGGNREGWERVPYWLDGFIPLAYLLEDADLIARAKKYVDAILDAQQDDGWLCPCPKEKRAGYDMWALLLIGKVLVLYYDCSRDERIPGVLYRAFRNFAEHIRQYPIFNWAKTRWYEGLISLDFLYRHQPEEWMIQLAKELNRQGWDINEQYTNWKYAKPKWKWQWDTHVVNQAMALKAGALFSPFSGDDPDRLPKLMLSTLRRDHGMAHGHFTGDECLAGTSPSQGTELCGVAEAMYSEEHLLAFTGNTEWGDWLEMLAFNAFPATTSTDMWAHQYVQQTNQIASTAHPEGAVVYTTNNAFANMFGLEPHFGCCTANMGQAWPKFTLSTWMRGNGADDVLFNTLPAPSCLTTTVNGTKVQIKVVTDYPFKGSIRYQIDAEKDVEFELQIRIPGSAATAKLDGADVAPGSIAKRRQIWNAGTTPLQLELTFTAALESRPGNMFVLKRGPLLFSLPLRATETLQEWEQDGVIRKFPYCDYHYLPLEKWNYGFFTEDFEVEEHPVPAHPFDTNFPAVVIKGKFAEIDWQSAPGNPCCAGHAPAGRTPLSAPVEKTMIPYGCTMLRMTEMPKAE